MANRGTAVVAVIGIIDTGLVVSALSGTGTAASSLRFLRTLRSSRTL